LKELTLLGDPDRKCDEIDRVASPTGPQAPSVPALLNAASSRPKRATVCSTTVFRVRVEGLKPGITYYYTVDSMGNQVKDTQDTAGRDLQNVPQNEPEIYVALCRRIPVPL
jgi:hypothetical protein